MEDSKNSPVTQADFKLFEQEINHKYSLFENNMISSVKDTIREQLNTIRNWTVSCVGFFILALWTYFEFSHNKAEQLNSERLARMETIDRLSSERLIRMETIEAGLLAIFKEAGIIKDKKDVKKYNPASALNPDRQTGKQRKVKGKKK